MSNATTLANPTGQIATTPAVLSPETPIVPTSGTKRVPDDSEATVVQDAQQYDPRVDLDSIEACEDISECADGCCTYFTSRHMDECIRLAAHIERLEAERDAAERDAATLQSIVGDTVKAKLLRELFHAYSNGELVERFDLEADLNTVKAERDALLDALRWCGGSADFGHGGQAREGWQRNVAPLLDNAERVIRG